VTQGVALGWMMERHWRSSPPGEIPIPGTPTAFHRSAQGCRSREAAKATLGLRSKIVMNPNGVPSVRTTQDLGRRIQPRWDCFDILAGSQGSARRATLGWHVTRPLALDTSASQPFFGYQPFFSPGG